MLRPKISRVYNDHTLIFCCRHCNTEFNIYQDKEHYCHNCGSEQDWGAISFTKLDSLAYQQFLYMSYNEQQDYLAYLDYREARI